MAAGYCYCLGIKSNNFFLKDNKKAFILWLNVPKVTAYFPTIFSLALRDAGTKTKLASSLLIMTIVGGAVAPVIMGYIADTTGSMGIAFLIPLVCYGVIGTYALSKRHVPL